MKSCKTCLAQKEISEFHKNSSRKDGYMNVCKVCNSARMRAWYAKNMTPEKVRDKSIKQHGLTVEQYEKMFESQGSHCATCPEDVGPFVIDHKHSCCSGRYSCGECVRGILCGPCNVTLGMSRESTDRLRNIISYLDE